MLNCVQMKYHTMYFITCTIYNKNVKILVNRQLYIHLETKVNKLQNIHLTHAYNKYNVFYIWQCMDITKKLSSNFLKINKIESQSTETLLNMLVTVDQHKHRDVSSALGQPDAGQWASGELSELWTNSAPPAWLPLCRPRSV